MKKIYLKLAASVMSILMAFTMIIGATYAWLTLSKSPAVNGINVTISGGKTIMLAADLTATATDAEGKQITVHYPGAFSNSLNFDRYDTYDYLEEVSGLSPVSTADGLYWILPAYDEETGVLKKVSRFTVDDTLENANVTGEHSGSYIYLDFWMVSPGVEYKVRVSTDTQNNTGSFLMELPEVEETEGGSLQLVDTPGVVAASARVGFLTNSDTAGTEGMTAYISSEDYNSQYKSLQGVYQEKGQKPSGDYQFAIYEPNATMHPSEDLEDGDYIITKPLWYNSYGNTILEEDISSRLMIQTANTWREFGGSSKLEQFFNGWIANKDDMTAEKAASGLYTECLKGQPAAYVKSGDFYRSTAALYAAAENGVVRGENMSNMTAGATDDCVITTLAPNIPQRIRMFIWLEGQDADCANIGSVAASGFALGIEFSGADQ